MVIDFNSIKSLYLANSEVEELYINGSKVWEKGSSMPLTFTAEEANSTVAMTARGSAPSVSLEYTIDNGSTWSDFIVGTTTVILANVGDKMVIRAKTTNSGMGSGESNYNYFVMTGKIAASGSIMYLLKSDGDLDTISSDWCFRRLFYNCSSLTQAPELPATSLAHACYIDMFYNCSSLTQAPALPATTLSSLCYASMFYGCTSLTTTSALPATTMVKGCYRYMFYNCTSLTTAPELPATTLANTCYANMLRKCSSLNEIKIGYTGNFSGTGVPDGAFLNWVQDVASTGTLYYNGSDTTRGASAIPTGWEVRGNTWPGLTFTAEQANSTVSMQKVGSAPDVSLEYSTDDGRSWNTFTVGSTTVTLANIGDEVCFRAGSGGNTTFGTSPNKLNRFVTTGSLDVKGNIMSLLDQTMTSTTISTSYTFAYLFQDNRYIVDASELELPATTLAERCYVGMFNGCSSLTTAPDLPATTLAASCYSNMFDNCQNLTQAPSILSATTLASYCYGQMFRGTRITTAPELPATTLDTGCYYGMFQNCYSLNSIKIGYTGNFSGDDVPTNAFNNWVNDVSYTGTFYYNGSDTTRGTSAIPNNWTVQSF